MQILVPLAGRSPFFKPEDYPFPKPLIEIGGRPMIERVIENLKGISGVTKFIFVVRQEDVARFSLDTTLRLISPGCEIVSLRNDTKGALCSALMAIDKFSDNLPLIICNGDQIIEADFSAITPSFLAEDIAAGVITFESVHPRWSYVQLGKSGRVIEAAEKRVISRHAVAGFYFFKAANFFIDAAMRCIKNNNSVNGNFFIAPALNELILDDRRVVAHSISSDKYHSFYSPAKIQEFEETRLIQRLKQAPGFQRTKVRVVIPAAGDGARFQKAGYSAPKPFIDVLGKPMIERVLENVTPDGAQVHILLRADHLKDGKEIANNLTAKGYRLHVVEALTQGTACTLLLARDQFDDDGFLLVANSDQLVDFSVGDFIQDCIDRGLDGSILVFRDTTRNPKWSFARVDDQQRVVEVAEKRPISDLATVGIYLFARGADFIKGAIDMMIRNDRVNNEFYTCPVYNYLIADGCRIGIFEVPMAAMHGLGTPEDLASFLSKSKSGG
jgi:dTDP-glucose pyrophosphorylase